MADLPLEKKSVLTRRSIHVQRPEICLVAIVGSKIVSQTCWSVPLWGHSVPFSSLPISPSPASYSHYFNLSLLLIFFPPSLSHSGTTSTGRGTTFWAWPVSPRTSWLRFLTSSSLTWEHVGSNHRQHPLPTHHRDNLSKPRYEEQARRGKKAVLERGVSWTLRTKYFHLPKAALHALWLWIAVVFHVFRKLHAGARGCHFSGQEKPTRVCLLKTSSIPVSVWNFYCYF